MKQANIFDRHVDIALQCLDKHEPNKAFPPHLKSFYKANRKFGSKDRRRIGQLCYAWFRVGYSFSFLDKKQQMILAYFLFAEVWLDWMDEVLSNFGLEVETWEKANIASRLNLLATKFGWDISSCFPHAEMVSSQLDENQNIHYQFTQPKMWVRGKRNLDVDKLERNLPEAVVHRYGGIGLPLGTSLKNLHLEHLVEIQDLSSQMVYNKIDLSNVETVWDCCCASGGKSLNLLDRNQEITLYGSDNRKNIISNFLKRTSRHKNRIWSAIVDARVPRKRISFANNGKTKDVGTDFFDLILADVPCSGSGTWNRNPEFKYCYNRDIKAYQDTQKAIVDNAMRYLKLGGILCYTTCSIYQMENEDVVKSCGEILESGYIKGYEHQSDFMFYAFVKKN